MIIKAATMDDFGAWLLHELEEQGLSQSDLSKKSGLSQGTISNILSGRRGRGPESLHAIATALKIPTETIYRKAGFLPPEKQASEEEKEILHRVEDLSEDEKNAVLDFIEVLMKLRRKKH